jgi:hypothetical protein
MPFKAKTIVGYYNGVHLVKNEVKRLSMYNRGAFVKKTHSLKKEETFCYMISFDIRASVHGK